MNIETEVRAIFKLLGEGHFDEGLRRCRDCTGRRHSCLSATTAWGMLSPPCSVLGMRSPRSDISMLGRSVLLHAKSRCVAAAKDYSREYDLLRESKLMRGSTDNSDAFGRRVDALISEFTAERIAEVREIVGENPFRPIYVVGLPRSGTTLVERILSAHSAVSGAGELTLITDFFSTVLNGKPVSEFVAMMRATGGAATRRLINEIEATMRFLGDDKDRIVDKMPHNFLYAGLLAAIFPQGAIVHCFRSPADNFLSGLKANLKHTHRYFDDPSFYISYYGHYRRLMEHWYKVLPGRIFPLHYETLVTKPEATIASLLAFCGLDWEEDCLYPEREQSRIGTASVLQARSPINAKSVGGWKKYRSQLQIIADTCGEGNFSPLAAPAS